ncbi:MMPL family transporter [Isosphaeraceae bacterium EP7]
MISTLLRARYVSLAVVVLTLVSLALFGRRVSYEQSIKSFFADDDPELAKYKVASDSFGDDNFVFVAYDDPELLTPGGMDRVAELARELGPLNIEGVLRIESLDAMPVFWKIDEALVRLEGLPMFARNIAVAGLMRGVKGADLAGSPFTIGAAVRAGGDEKTRTLLRERITAHPLLLGTLVNSKATSTALVVRLRKTEEHDVIRTIGGLRSKADAFTSRHKLGTSYVVGPPVLLADGFASIEVDGKRLAAVGMALIALVTLGAVRSVWWAIVPLLCGWTVWLATEEILSVFDLRLSLSGGPLVAQIIVLTMPAASHLAIHFRDERRRRTDPEKAARSTLQAVAVPITWCAVTGAIGYGALLTSSVVPIQQFGWIMGACTFVSAMMVMALSPVAMMPPWRMEIPVKPGSTSRASNIVAPLLGLAYRRPGLVVIATVALALPLALGIARLRYESNYINAFRPTARVVKDYHSVESRLGGIGLVELIVPVGNAITPAHMAQFRAIGGGSGDGASSEVRPISLATVLDPDHRLEEELDEAAYAHALTTKLDLIAASPQSELLASFWNKTTGEARILVRVSEQQPAEVKDATFRRVEAKTKEVFGPGAFLTGLSYLMTKTVQGVILTQWTTFIWSVLGILAMLTIALRGPFLAALAMLPTLLAVALVLGLMGWLGVKLDMATALVASVALGLSVDDTFHCLLQYRRERKEQDFKTSLFDSYAVTGPGVLLSSLAVAVGFAALRLSEFEPFVNFGTMVGIATAGSTLGNILLLPACLTLADRVSTRRPTRVPAKVS